MTGEILAVLDACVLIPMPLADTLLRMAEHPQLYRPQWTDIIIKEVSRNLVLKFNKTMAQAVHPETELKKAFPEARVEGYLPLVAQMNNDLKDRHLLAAAVQSESEVIVTYNKRDFPHQSTEPWGIAVQGPSAFLRGLYEQDPAVVMEKLGEQSENLKFSIAKLMERLRVNVPRFVDALDRDGRWKT